MYYATYKCKLCGKIFTSNGERYTCKNDEVAKQTVTLNSFGYCDSIYALRVSERFPHHCENGDWGIGEFIGMSQRS